MIQAARRGTAAEAARGVEAVITMSPAGQRVLSIFEGDGGVIAAADRGLTMVDAPVSGGVGGAQSGAPTFM